MSAVLPWVLAAAFFGSPNPVHAQAQAQAPNPPATAAPERRLRIVGGLAGVSQYTLHEEKFWTRDLDRLSHGRFTASIVPFNQAGVPGPEMLNLMKLGVVPFGTALLGQVATDNPDLVAADLAGLSPDLGTLRRLIGAYRPTLEKTLRDRYDVELLAVYVYPAQVLFCKREVLQLGDLAGRRIRVSSPSQADFIRAVGGTPVFTEFAEIMSNMRSDNTECAITGAMSGNTLGLQQVTTTLYNMPLTWGLGIFGANADAWRLLPADLQKLLKTELPKLEAEIWAESERDTVEGVACNTGSASCTRAGAAKGAMHEVKPSAADDARRRQLVARDVVQGWVQRCGANCAKLWDEVIAPAMASTARSTVPK